MYVFGLGKETHTCMGRTCKLQVRGNPTIFLMWGNSSDYCSVVPPLLLNNYLENMKKVSLYSKPKSLFTLVIKMLKTEICCCSGTSRKHTGFLVSKPVWNGFQDGNFLQHNWNKQHLQQNTTQIVLSSAPFFRDHHSKRNHKLFGHCLFITSNHETAD